MAQISGSITLILLVFARLGCFLMALPLTGDDLVPGRIRLLLALAVSAALTPLLSPQLAPLVAALPPAGPGASVALAGLMLREMLVGFALAMLLRAPFWAAQMAGSIASTQIGLTSAIVPDPGGSGQLPVLGRFVGLAALLVCLALGLHHLWLSALVGSYEVFPPGGTFDLARANQAMIAGAGLALALAAGLAAPLLAYGLIFHLLLGLISRVAPSLQIFFIAQPLLILIGLVILMASFAAIMAGFAAAQADWVGRVLQ